MAGPLQFERIRETSAIEGTGTLTLLGPVTGAYSFSSKLSNSDTCYFVIEAVDNEGNLLGPNEIALGTYSSNTLTRTTVRRSNSVPTPDNLVDFDPGLKIVTLIDIAKNSIREIPSGTINGTNDTFTLSKTPILVATSLFLYKNGLLQVLGNDYTLSGTTITFLSGAIPSGSDQLTVVYQY